MKNKETSNVPPPAESEVTQLLRAAKHGDATATAQLFPVVYQELRALAAVRMSQTPSGQTLQPTALVHEAYLRLVGSEDPGWENRWHFFFVAARTMHDILVDQARQKASKKRGGGWRRASTEQLAIAVDAPPDDLIALSEALEKLEQEDPRGYKLVMLRFFGGLTLSDAAAALEISMATAKRDWQFARTRLHSQLTEPLTRALAITTDE